ncbi:hypothetical protein LX15_000129 [Streptoalloteichus tenebrarius]|uniref:Uncharacterized protein n=1 Tax=Streptoalloteichus tenebrarius (strain ATCC 17920 / DSM 40477 / JCM 4838 / CBS 697.72 / NBRC 16177 / NCIMB 11028 / NRRL B-12390 / A12253. 1 / ISP 5477) TaxID=1933 RepID=A0ABT1HLQ2_STRSD|nr:hypothetical protein [Streptoalloteichus tenebrarius]
MERIDDAPEPVDRLTDEEAAFWRFVRFGELPPRVLPDDMVGTVETEQPSLPADRPFDPGEYGG